MCADRPTEVGVGFVPLLRPSVATADLDGEVVLYDEATETVHHLNSTATVIWSCFDGTTSVADIAADLASVYESDAATVLNDVLELTRSLGHRSLLVGVPGDVEAEPAERSGAPADGDRSYG